MASPGDLAERSTQLLPAGSVVRHAFVCQSAPNFAFFLVNWMTGLTLPWITYRCVAVTDNSIYILDSPKLSGGARPRSVIASLPRHTRLGPVSGRWGQIYLLDERHWVKKRFQGEIMAADAESGFTD